MVLMVVVLFLTLMTRPLEAEDDDCTDMAEKLLPMELSSQLMPEEDGRRCLMLPLLVPVPPAGGGA